MPVARGTSPPGVRAPRRGRSRPGPWGAARPPGGARPGASSRPGPATRRSLPRPRRHSLRPRRSSGRAKSTSAPVLSRRAAPRQSLTLEFLRADDPAGRVARDPLRRSTATAARAANVSASRTSSSENRASIPSLSCAVITPIGRSRTIISASPYGSKSPADLLVDLEILDHRVDSLASAAGENATGLRGPRSRRSPTSSSPPSPAVACTSRSPSWFGRAIRTMRAWTSSRKRVATRSRSRARSRRQVRSRLRSATPAVSASGSRPRRAAHSRLRPPPGSTAGRQLFVLVGERNASLLLGEVEVSVGSAAQKDGDSEETFSSADGSRGSRPSANPAKGRRGAEASRPGSAHRGSRGHEEVADGSLRLRVDACDDELLERLTAGIDDAQRRIAGSGQLSGRLDDSLEDGVERQLGRECDTRVHDCSQAIHVGHAVIMGFLTSVVRTDNQDRACGRWATRSLTLPSALRP